MARGESDKSEPRGPAIGIWGLFGTLTLGVLLLVVWSVRECEPDPVVSSSAGDPLLPVRAAFGLLGWRDCVAEHEALASLEVRLEQRGYERSTAPGTPLELPITVTPPELGGACGVVVFVAEGTSRITSVGEDDRAAFTPCSERITTFGACGGTAVRAQGVGQARVAVWIMPGVTPAALDATGIPHDLALAHAEAETLIARHGLTPSDQALTVGLERSDPLDARALPRPRSGCVPWIVATASLGGVQALRASETLSTDYAQARALAGAVTCRDASDRTTFQDAEHDGGTYVAIPYGSRPSGGPALPGDEATLSRIGSVRTVSRRAIELPRPLE